MTLGSTQPLTEMSTKNLPGGKGRPARKVDNLTASQLYGPPRPVTGISDNDVLFSYNLQFPLRTSFELHEIGCSIV
jgi:hypothetical protein